ncbi:Bre1 [Kluyveromyces lactis]|nr:Bre1 [Kluyveromyces lactis]
MNDHIVKRPKLELSDPSEPLTQKDVIAFQKEALFRCLNKWRVKANQLVEENEVLAAGLSKTSESVSGCSSSIVVLARSVVENCSDEQDKHFLQQLINTEDEHTLTQMISNNSARICELILKTRGSDVSDNIGRLQELESLTLNLQKLLKSSENKLKKATEYYENIIAQYDRQDSESVSRVFNTAEDDSNVKKDKQSSTGANSVNDEPNDNTDKSQSNKESVVSQAQHEIEINDLNTKISVLEATVKELTEWKNQNERELSELRQTVASTKSALSSNQIQSNSQHQPDASVTNEKISSLTKQNEQLQQINEAYLTKFQQLSSDREIFHNKLTSEFNLAQETLKKHNASLEKDLVRIRTVRDELLAKVSLLEAQKTKSEMLEDLEKSLNIQQEQLQKFESRSSENTSQDALMKELQDLEKAFREVSHLSNKKYAAYMNQESVLSKLTVEKTKASEKYFAAMRSKDAIMIENKNLSKNLNKSNELIVQLKDLEKTLQQKIANVHMQLSLSQENEKRVKESNKETSMKIVELSSENNKLKKSTERLESETRSLIGTKTELESKIKDKDIENKQLKIKVSSAEAKSKKLYKTLLSNGGDNGALAEELENFRTIIYCSLCSKNWKNTALKTCGHVFCDVCCKERLAARMRKCPTCNKPFSSNDLLSIHL